MSNVKTVDLADRMTAFTERTEPGEFNGRPLRRLRLRAGEACDPFPAAVEFFHVLRGRLEIETGAERIVLERGEMHVVPAGTACHAVALEHAELLVIDPARQDTRLH
ncbi:cupin domain-containing protein [Mangrovicoccus algicola]|uniref:Cupin domain-containing protein n=1 Tax=Mangrovicoccus algicola TaxID=2771008 RepID=A0A8J7CTR1_9RHOB|nr:cupin domain-containing protein [Mangrovicoccus algicola]MBE3636929.1 cupin domain-containing protein [Mangrovicoccus algicola]